MERENKTKAVERLQRALIEMPKLERLRNDSPAFEKWRRRAGLASFHTLEGDSR